MKNYLQNLYVNHKSKLILFIILLTVLLAVTLLVYSDKVFTSYVTIALVMLFNLFIFVVMLRKMLANRKRGYKKFTIRSFFGKALNILEFFYNNHLLLIYFVFVLFGLVNGLNWGYFDITGLPKQFNIFIFIHRVFTIYPFIVVIATAVLIYLNPKITKKPSLKVILFLSLDNVTFTGFILYVCIGFFWSYTGIQLIILAYFLPILVDLFANLPNILVDFLKLHSLGKTIVSLVKSPKVIHFSEAAFSLRTKANLNDATGFINLKNYKYIPHLSLTSPYYLPAEQLMLSNTVKALVSKRVFRSALSNIAISLVEKDIFKPVFLLTLSKCDNLVSLELMVVQGNKLACRSSTEIKCSKNGKSFLDNFENNTSMFYAQQGKFNQTIIVNMYRQTPY